MTTTLSALTASIESDFDIPHSRATRVVLTVAASLASVSGGGVEPFDRNNISDADSAAIRDAVHLLLSEEDRGLVDVARVSKEFNEADSEARRLHAARDEAIYRASDDGHTRLAIAQAAGIAVMTVDRAVRRVHGRRSEA